MWTLIFIGMAIATLAMLMFLGSRFCRFDLVKRLSKDRKIIRIVIAVLIVLVLCISLHFLFGIINMPIILIHLGVIWAICDGIVYFIGRKKQIPGNCYWAGIFALIITTGYLGCGWYLAHHVWEKDYTVTTEKKVGNLRVVMFADSHVGTTFDGEGFGEHVAAMQQTNPDVVVVVGDYVDDDTTREDMIASCEALGTLETTYGVYYAFGNHDKGYYGQEFRGYRGDDLIEELEKNGVHVLQDEAALVDGRFYIIGRQDRSEEQRTGSRATMEELMQGLDSEKFSIVLDHQPHDYQNQTEAKADLVLSGHTHAGQLFPINYLGEWTHENEKTYGLEKREETSFIVTSGISDWAITFKTGCKSEFVVVDIQGK